mmetsp:Transcript_115064/g.358335  ORF Transcript_115064/g.358335 Transcript_115064/m.358335 type:complete len:238 (+) Transcript_115064:260-973(+)
MASAACFSFCAKCFSAFTHSWSFGGTARIAISLPYSRLNQVSHPLAPLGERQTMNANMQSPVRQPPMNFIIAVTIVVAGLYSRPCAWQSRQPTMLDLIMLSSQLITVPWAPIDSLPRATSSKASKPPIRFSPVFDGRSAPAVSINAKWVRAKSPEFGSFCVKYKMSAQCDRELPSCPPPAWFIFVLLALRFARTVAMSCNTSSMFLSSCTTAPRGMYVSDSTKTGAPLFSRSAAAKV